MVGKLMGVASLWRLPRGCHVGLVDLVSILAVVLLQEQGVASIVELKATGLAIARLETGRTNVIVVGSEVI